MSNTQMTILIITILVSQFGALYYISGRIDLHHGLVSDLINQMGLKIDRLIDTVHGVDVRVVKIETADARKAS
jgi:hypothetical protein